MMSEEKLMPCPFCGEDVDIAAIPTATSTIIHHPPYDRYCCMSDKFVPLTAWNTRPAREEVSGEEVERVARAIQDAHAPGHPLNHVSIYQARAAIAAMNPKPAEAEGEVGQAFLRLCEEVGVPATAVAYLEYRNRRATPATEKAVERDAISDIISDVAELPDRDSPEDCPDAMLVTGEELRIILERYTAPPASDVAGLREALEWYAEQVRGCRKITSEGDEARKLLDKDGGARARQALAALPEEPSA